MSALVGCSILMVLPPIQSHSSVCARTHGRLKGKKSRLRKASQLQSAKVKEGFHGFVVEGWKEMKAAARWMKAMRCGPDGHNEWRCAGIL